MAKESTIDFIILAIALLITDKILWIMIGIKVIKSCYWMMQKVRELRANDRESQL